VSDRPLVVVTGGSRGIGAASVCGLAARGYDVVFTYRSSVDAADEVRRSASSSGSEITALPMDARSEPTVDAVREWIQEHHQRLDGLVLNAGIWHGGRITEISPDAWTDVIDTNLSGVFRVARALVPLLRTARDPSIVVVSSVIGVTGFPGDTAYASAKAGLIGFAKSLAKEQAPSVRVNVVAPGFIETDMTAAVSDAGREKMSRQTLLGRCGSAHEVAAAVTFLVADATYCTGTVLTVDGGFSC
jgi:3-oxoacyl-[acyl-carrier protein] reductase